MLMTYTGNVIWTICILDHHRDFIICGDSENVVYIHSDIIMYHLAITRNVAETRQHSRIDCSLSARILHRAPPPGSKWTKIL